MNTNPVKAIFFDMDGLLVDTESLSFESAREVLAGVDVKISKEWYIRENLGQGKSSLSLARDKGISEKEIEQLRTRRKELYRQLLSRTVEPLDGVPEVLSLLQDRFVLAIVTSSQRDNFELVMEKTGLAHFFDFVITGDDVTKLKPDPEPYLRALGMSKQDKQYCLVLEDSLRGVQSAKAAGLKCYAIPDALTREQNFSIADRVLTSIHELPPLLGL